MMRQPEVVMVRKTSLKQDEGTVGRTRLYREPHLDHLLSVTVCFMVRKHSYITRRLLC